MASFVLLMLVNSRGLVVRHPLLPPRPLPLRRPLKPLRRLKLPRKRRYACVLYYRDTKTIL